MENNNVKDHILKILNKHPEGLTISQIAKEVGMHRHSIVKYIYELTGEKKIIQRKIGPATLCYIYKKKFEKSFASLAVLFGILIVPHLLSLQIPVMFLGIALIGEKNTKAFRPSRSIKWVFILLIGAFMLMNAQPAHAAWTLDSCKLYLPASDPNINVGQTFTMTIEVCTSG